MVKRVAPVLPRWCGAIGSIFCYIHHKLGTNGRVKMMNNGPAMEWGIKNDGDQGECSVGLTTTIALVL